MVDLLLIFFSAQTMGIFQTPSEIFKLLFFFFLVVVKGVQNKGKKFTTRMVDLLEFFLVFFFLLKRWEYFIRRLRYLGCSFFFLVVVMGYGIKVNKHFHV